MGDKSKISWTDATWNPTVGCTRVSPGCDNCYAFALHDKRFAANRERARQVTAGMLGAYEAIDHARDVGYELPYPRQYDRPFSHVQLIPDRLDQPLRWRRPRRIFVDSMADLFHEDVDEKYISKVFGVMDLARILNGHTFQVLTKRPGRMKRLLTDENFVFHVGWFQSSAVRELGLDKAKVDADFAARPWSMERDGLPNVWLGVSVEDQERADERIPLLLDTPAAVRFVSAEPLLGPVNLHSEVCRIVGQAPDCGPCMAELHWVIVGGESGPRFRAMDLEWARSIRDQCVAAGVPFFYKQGSAASPGRFRELDGRTWEEMPA